MASDGRIHVGVEGDRTARADGRTPWTEGPPPLTVPELRAARRRLVDAALLEVAKLEARLAEGRRRALAVLGAARTGVRLDAALGDLAAWAAPAAPSSAADVADYVPAVDPPAASA